MFDLHRPNNAGYIGENYSKILAMDTCDELRGGSAISLSTLKKANKWDHYLGEEPAKVGYGVRSKGTRAFMLVPAYVQDESGISGVSKLYVVPAQYDWRNRFKKWEEPTVELTNHAINRLYERLRSNSFADLRRAVVPLINLPSAVSDELPKVDVVVEGAGYIPCTRYVGGNEKDGFQYSWIAKTFIPFKK